MIKILFVCHGNICRSPMAEYCFKDIVEKAGKQDKYFVSSAAVSSEEEGNHVYPPARKKLKEQGIDCSGKRARRIVKSDYGEYDHIIGMDSANIRMMINSFGGDPVNKIKKLLWFAGSSRDIADPWYTDDFDTAWNDIEKGCKAMFAMLETNK